MRRPDDRLPDRHAEEVLPANCLLVRIFEGLFRHHADGTPTGLDLFEKGVVAQACRHRVPFNVIPDPLLDRFIPGGFVILPICVLSVGLEMQEVGTDRTVAVLESGEDDPVLHLRHLGAHKDRQRVGRGAAPRGVPGPPHTFSDRAGLEDVRRAAGSYDDRLGTEHVEVPVSNVKADGASDPVGPRLVHQQVGHHDPVVDFGGGLARGLGDDRLVALAVDHNLPFAFALVPPGFRVPHDGKAPLLELVHCGVDMPSDIVTQILAHQTHEIIACVADMVFGSVLVPLHAHVAVDRIQALCDSAAALDVCFFDADDF